MKRTKNTAKTATKAAKPAKISLAEQESGPNAKWPFGIRVTAADGKESFERYNDAETRDNRMKNMANDHIVTAADYVQPDEAKNPGKPEIKVAPPVVDKPLVIKPLKGAKKEAAKPAAKKAAATGDPIVKLLSKGVIYFPKSATEFLRGLPYVVVVVKGAKVTLTPTKSAKDSLEVRHSQIGVSKLIKDTGWNKKTQDLPIKAAGESFSVEVR